MKKYFKTKTRGYWNFEGLIPKHIQAKEWIFEIPLKRIRLRKELLRKENK